MARMHFILVVFGESYTNFFLNYSLPTQMSENNIPSLKDREHCVYHIYTTRPDAEIMKKTKIFQKLESILHVETHFFMPDEIYDHEYRKKNNISTISLMNFAHKHALNNSKNEYLVILSPDILVADKTFANIEARLDEGYDAVVMIALRMKKESAYSQWPASDEMEEGLLIDNRDLVDCLTHHAHPVTQSLTHNLDWKCDVHDNLWPSILIWKTKEGDLIAHSPHLHPIAIKHTAGNIDFATTIDGDLLKTMDESRHKIYFAQKSDEILIVECSETAQHKEALAEKPYGILPFAEWTRKNTDGINGWMITKPMLFRTSKGQLIDLLNASKKTSKNVENILKLSKYILENDILK